MKYRKKIVEVEAIQFTRENLDKIKELTGNNLKKITIDRHPDGTMTAELHTINGYYCLEENDYIVKDKKGNLSMQRPRVFESEYEKAGD